MIDPAESVVQLVSVHHVGNASLEEGVKLSQEPLDIEHDKVNELLKTYFLSNFTVPEYYSFTFSNEDFTLNPLYKFVREVFDDRETFHENSVYIAQHLYEATKHPNIKAGDLYIAYFGSLALNGRSVEAVGIFKSENKEPYLKLKAYSNQFDLLADEGINIRKLDKGCIVLNLEHDSGFKVLIVDNANRADAQFWKESFLNLKPWSDAFHQTHQVMNLTRQFVSEKITEDFQVSKADQIDLLNRSVNYFKSKEQYNQAEFEVEVLGDADMIESFRNYGKTFQETNNYDLEDNFEISVQAVKRQARVFKSVLKLDKNFHVYIHGDRGLIERGFDEVMGKNFYKLYFEHES
jgi:hypothetical protein